MRDVAHAMGFGASFNFASASDIYDEITSMTRGRPNDQTGIDYDRLRSRGPQRWPHAEGQEPRQLYADHVFATQSGRARFWARPFLEQHELPNAHFPLILTTGRVENQWHTRTKTGTIERLNRLDPVPFLSMNADDARALGLSDGSRVVVRSRRGETITTLRLRSDMAPGVVFMPMHWNDLWEMGASVNEVTSSATDPISKEPSLKYCAVSVEALV